METKQVQHAVSGNPSQLPQNPETPADREELPGQPQHQGDVSAREDVRIDEEPPVTTEGLPGPEVSTEPVVPLPNVHHYNANPDLRVEKDVVGIDQCCRNCSSWLNEDTLRLVAGFLMTFVIYSVTCWLHFELLGDSSPENISNKEPVST